MREVEEQEPSKVVSEPEKPSESDVQVLSDQDLDDVAGASAGRKHYPPYL